MTAALFEQIAVDAETGAIAFPAPDGFELDVDRTYRSAERFLPFCRGDIAMAVRHAIYEQLIARAHAAVDAVLGRAR